MQLGARLDFNRTDGSPGDDDISSFEVAAEAAQFSKFASEEGKRCCRMTHDI